MNKKKEAKQQSIDKYYQRKSSNGSKRRKQIKRESLPFERKKNSDAKYKRANKVGMDKGNKLRMKNYVSKKIKTRVLKNFRKESKSEQNLYKHKTIHTQMRAFRICNLCKL